jgi:hypothetical protein
MTERTYNGGRSYPIPVWNGIFEHQREIGPAIWVYLWCLDRITREESACGFVLGGTPVTASRIASDLQDDSERTVRRHLERLAKCGYLELKRAPYGVVITVTNSRKFGIWSPVKNGPLDRTKMPTRSATNADLADKFVQCNKEDSAVDSAQRQLLPPNPPLGGLTPRQRQNLSKELNHIYQKSIGTLQDVDFDESALQTACLRLCLPLDAARKAIAESYGKVSA